ncbi:MAG: Hint domain-containing protein [Pseudomonadota bacterium]
MGLLALFDFFDALGAPQAQDSAGVAQNATFYGDAQADGAGTAGFDGDGDYAVIDPDPTFDLDQGTVELSFVQNTASMGNAPFGGSAAQTIFSSDASGTVDGHLTIYIRSDGILMVRHQTDGQHHYYSGDTVTLGQPIDISYSFGPSGSTLVMNGVTVDTGTQAHSLTGGTNPIVIGASTANSSSGSVNNPVGFFDGDISRVAIYDDQTGSRSAAPACFARGTLIETLNGPRKVETLRRGDPVITLDNGPLPLLATVAQAVDAAALRENDALRPIKIAAGAMGNGQCLVVSRQHCLAMRLDNEPVLVRAGHLADYGPGVFRRADGIKAIQYFHILFRSHELVRAEGCWAESLKPDSPAAASRTQAVVPDPARLCRAILSGRQVRDGLRRGRLRPYAATDAATVA